MYGMSDKKMSSPLAIALVIDNDFDVECIYKFLRDFAKKVFGVEPTEKNLAYIAKWFLIWISGYYMLYPEDREFFEKFFKFAKESKEFLEKAKVELIPSQASGRPC